MPNVGLSLHRRGCNYILSDLRRSSDSFGRGAIENGTGIMKKTYEKPQLVAAGSLARNTAAPKVTRVLEPA